MIFELSDEWKIISLNKHYIVNIALFTLHLYYTKLQYNTQPLPSLLPWCRQRVFADAALELVGRFAKLPATCYLESAFFDLTDL